MASIVIDGLIKTYHDNRGNQHPGDRRDRPHHLR